MSYAMEYPIAARAEASERAAFMQRTYAHLAGAILAFAGIETVLLRLPNIRDIIMPMTASWPLLMIGFMVVAFVADRWAQSDTSRAIQYLGLALYIGVEAIIFLPMLYVANERYSGAISTAGIITLGMFGGLTAAVLVTRKDFSHMRAILSIGSCVALAVIVASYFFGFAPGLWFSVAMIALACGFILYDTSNVLHHYRTDQHVAASLALFASVALLFWYVLRFVMASNRD